MNVLIFVTTMLMLLGMISYGRLGMYFNSQVVQVFFQTYMEKVERAHFESKAKLCYDSLIKTSKTSGQKQNPRVEASRKISLSPLIDQEMSEKNPELAKESKLLLKHLISSLFGDKEWFQKRINERQNIIDELIESIVDASYALPKENKIKKIEEIETLKLADKDLDHLLYQMLQTIPFVTEPLPLMKEEADTNEAESLESSESDPQNESSEVSSPLGFYSLLDGITLSKNNKIRVFLSPKVVLEAIFQNKEIVKNIINEREKLFKQANNQNISELSKAFETQFSQEKRPDINASSLDFSVSKTNPKE